MLGEAECAADIVEANRGVWRAHSEDVTVLAATLPRAEEHGAVAVPEAGALA